jgi:hypothetical protein
MGQRHQIYLHGARQPNPKAAAQYARASAPDAPFKRWENYRVSSTGVIGLHHQWLYGHTAVQLLKQALEYAKRLEGEYHVFQPEGHVGSPTAALTALYSLDVRTGYYHTVSELDYGEVENPDRGDNNDGITIIDLTDPKRPGYCFVNLRGSELDGVPAYAPLTAHQYLRHYYHNYLLPGKDAKQERWFKQMRKDVRGVDQHKRHRLLAPDDLARIFPLCPAFARA